MRSVLDIYEGACARVYEPGGSAPDSATAFSALLGVDVTEAELERLFNAASRVDGESAWDYADRLSAAMNDGASTSWSDEPRPEDLRSTREVIYSRIWGKFLEGLVVGAAIARDRSGHAED